MLKESTNVIYLWIGNNLLSVLDLVRIYQGGSWGQRGAKTPATTRAKTRADTQ